jgi:hypothetical protein
MVLLPDSIKQRVQHCANDLRVPLFGCQMQHAPSLHQGHGLQQLGLTLYLLLQQESITSGCSI